MNQKTVSAVIPVFNEEKTVAGVIWALLDSKMVDQIVCVNDGSRDRSLKVLRGFGERIKIINFRQNQGKGKAVAAGIKKAVGEILLLCDSDLINFTSDHVRAMLKPVTEGRVKAVLAVPTQDKTGKYARNEAYLAGERVYPREVLLPHLAKISRFRGAGASEVFLNNLFKKKEIKIVPLIGLIKPSKEQKWPATIALKQYLLSAVGVVQELSQTEIKPPLKIKNFAELTAKIEELGNRDVRDVFQKYFLRYLDYVKKLTPKIKI